MQIGVLTTGAAVETDFTLNYLPAALYLEPGTVPTSIIVSVQGDGVIMQLDATGMAAVSSIRRYGNPANGLYLPLADGFIPNKVVTIAIINSAAQTPAVFGHSTSKGRVYITNLQQKVLAASGATFNNFAAFSLGTNVAVTDKITVGFKDGHIQEFVSTELRAVLSHYGNLVTAYYLDNVEGHIDYVRYIPTNDNPCYITRYQPIGLVDMV